MSGDNYTPPKNYRDGTPLFSGDGFDLHKGREGLAPLRDITERRLEAENALSLAVSSAETVSNVTELSVDPRTPAEAQVLLTNLNISRDFLKELPGDGNELGMEA